MSLLEVKNLTLSFETQRGRLQILRDVSLRLEAGESLGIVGESGSGKSLTGLSIMRLFSKNSHVDSGEILFQQKNLLQSRTKELEAVRGAEISMIFQDPMSALNPCFTVEHQLSEVLKLHQNLSGKSLRERVLEVLNQVGIPDPISRLKSYPHELSGGMSQRIMIAMAIACKPKILIADEPTTALDVTIQAQIMRLIDRLKQEHKMSLILVSHDLGLIARHTDRIAVMYAGEIVETGDSPSVISAPTHPYTRGLLECLPGHYVQQATSFRLPTIPGVVPAFSNRPKGCQLFERCSRHQDVCAQNPVPLINKEKAGQVRCLFPIQTRSKEVSL